MQTRKLILTLLQRLAPNRTQRLGCLRQLFMILEGKKGPAQNHQIHKQKLALELSSVNNLGVKRVR